MQRHVAILAVIIIEQRQLLGTMRGIIGIVDIQNNPIGSALIRTDKAVDKRLAYAVQGCAAHGVLQSRHRRLAAQVIAADRSTTTGYLQSRIGPQRVAVVSVFIPAGYLHNPLGYQFPHGVADVALASAVGNTVAYSTDNADCAFGCPQEQKAGVGGDDAALEIGDDVFASHAWELQRRLCIFYHAASLVLVNFFTIAITSNEAALFSYVKFLMVFDE